MDVKVGLIPFKHLKIGTVLTYDGVEGIAGRMTCTESWIVGLAVMVRKFAPGLSRRMPLTQYIRGMLHSP